MVSTYCIMASRSFTHVNTLPPPSPLLSFCHVYLYVSLS
jgi:hypothetical protein